MSAFMVDKVHVDMIVKVAVEGPQGCAGSPDRAWGRVSWFRTPVEEIEHLPYEEISKHHVTADWEDGPQRLGRDSLGTMLAAENLRSIHARYPDTIENPDATPGPIFRYWEEGYTYEDQRYTMTAVEALAALRCYEYQACEHGGWRTSEAFRFVESLRAHLVAALPGMNEAPWEWTARHVVEARGQSVR